MILVVDDDPRIVNTLATVLRHEGLEVESAVNGADAYEHVTSPDCRCMMLDINMPGVNGMELLQIMQSKGLQVPTIIMTGNKDFKRDEALAFPFVHEVLEKPFDVMKAVQFVRTLIRHCTQALFMTDRFRITGRVDHGSDETLSDVLSESTTITVHEAEVFDHDESRVLKARQLLLNRDQVQMAAAQDKISSRPAADARQ